MITGSNANVLHRGRVFHVQTEDSGRAHPHVTTLLYHEGTILASERRDYAQIVDAPDLVTRVRRLIEQQHAAVVERLRRGDFDAVIAARLSRPPGPERPPTSPTERPRAFGEGIVSQRTLDDVILEYLVAKSRERSRGGHGPGSEA